MGLLDSNAVRQYTKQVVISDITTSSSGGFLASPIDVKGYNTIRFRITDANNHLSDSQYIQIKSALNNRLYTKILSFYKIADLSQQSRVTANGEYVCIDISLADNIQFYIVGSQSYNLTIEYTLCNSSTVEGLLLNATNNINLKRELPLGQTSFSCDDTGNHFLDILPTAANLDSRYVGIKFHLTLSAVDDNVTLYIDAPLGDNSQAPRTNQLKLIDENGNFVFNIKDGAKKQNCFYFTDIVKDTYNIRCNIAGASGLTATVKCYAVSSIPSIAHIQEITSRTITATSTAQSINIWEYNLQYYKFYFATVETDSGTVSGIIKKNYLAGDDLDDTIVQFNDVSRACSDWVPVTFARKLQISLANFTGNGSATFKLFGVV